MTAPIDYRRRGQAVWLDSISSKMIQSGQLASRIESDTIYGVKDRKIEKDRKIGTLIIGSSAADGRDWVRTAWGAAPQQCRPPGEG